MSWTFVSEDSLLLLFGKNIVFQILFLILEENKWFWNHGDLLTCPHLDYTQMGLDVLQKMLSPS